MGPDEKERLLGEIRRLEREHYDLNTHNQKLQSQLQDLGLSDLAKVYEQLKRRGGLWLCDDKGNRVLYSNIQDAIDVLLSES